MKKKVLFFLTVAAVSALAACNINVKPSSSSLIPDESSSSESSSEDTPSSSSSSSSSEPYIDPVTTDIVIPSVELDEKYEAEKPYSDSMLLDHRFISVVADDGTNSANNTEKIKGLPQPLQPAKELLFRSLDESIATVDEEGVVKGIAQGKTSIEVTDKNHPDVKKMVPVDVFTNLRPEPKGTDDSGEEGSEDPQYHQDQIDSILQSLAEVDDSNLSRLVDHEIYEQCVYKNGVLHTYDISDEEFVLSKDDAYLRLTETDGEAKTDNGAITFTDYEWIFFTNEYYDTYVYHTQGDVKNYYPISTVGYMPEDPTVNNRYAPMFEVLDNIFVSGREIFTNSIQNAQISGEKGLAAATTAEYSNVKKNCYGSNLDENGNPEEGVFLFDYTSMFNTETASQDDETRYGIPYGTPMPATQRLTYTVKDNKIAGYHVMLTQTYEYGGDSYVQTLYMEHNYEYFTDENKDKFIKVPDVKDYNVVDYLFAI